MRELEIGARLKQARLALRFSQQEVADQLGIARERYATYEDGRVALRVRIGLRFCRQFIISERWLAIGQTGMPAQNKAPKRIIPTEGKVYQQSLDMRACMSLGAEVQFQKLDDSLLYSDVYNEMLASAYSLFHNKHFPYPRIILLQGDDPQIMRNLLNYRMDHAREGLDSGQAMRLFYSLQSEAESMTRQILEGYLTEVEKNFLREQALESGRISRADFNNDRKLWKALKVESEAYLAQFQPHELKVPLPKPDRKRSVKSD